MQIKVANKRQPGPVGEVQEKEIGGKKFKLGTSKSEVARQDCRVDIEAHERFRFGHPRTCP